MAMDCFEVINVDEKPTRKKWCMPLLRKISALRKISTWHIGFDGKVIIIIHGFEDGEKTTDTVVPELIKTDKNILSRALVEINARYRKKIKKGYTSGDPMAVTGVVTPMLANLYKDNMRIKFPIYCQVKLDGIRCMATRNPNIHLCSRSNTSYNHMTYIREEMDEFLTYFPSGTILDGEFYKHGTKLQNISSIVNKGREGGPIHKLQHTIKYCIFDVDMCNDTPFEHRYRKLVKTYKKYLADGNINKYFYIVSVNVIERKKDIHKYFDEAIYLGYEGIMLKKIAGKDASKADIKAARYVHYRSNNILKYKDHNDEEGTIVEVMDCKGREKGNAKFLVRDPRGNLFKLKIDSDFEYRRKLLKKRNKLIGMPITYKYSTLSDTGVPLHCHGLVIRDYE